ncbi:MAG: outer membrane beta-barrel protein, partial [Flavobacteriaceae bacterium]
NGFAGSGKWDALYNTSKNAQMEYVGRYNFGRFNNNALLLFNGESILENLQSRTKFTDQRLTYTNKINEEKALQITGRYIFDAKPQDYTVDTFLYEDLFPELNGIDLAAQNSRHQIRFFGLEGSYFLNTPKSNLNLRAGFAQKRNQLTSDLIFSDSLNNRFDAGSGFKNRLTYDLTDLYLKAQYKYSLKSVSFRSGLELHRFQVNINNGDTTDKTNPINAIPSLGLSWQINKKNRILSTYKYSTANLPFDQLYQGYLLSNYRNFRRGFGTFQQFRGSIFLTNYVMGNWSDSFLVHASFLYNRDHDYISNNNIVQANYLLYSPIKLKDREFYSFDLSTDKFIEMISTNFKINLSYSSNTLQNIVNTSSLRPVSSKTYSYGGELRSAFNGFIDFHIGTTWSESVVTVSQKNRNTNNYSFFDLDFSISEKISVEIENERYYFGNLAGDRSTFFSDLNARYDILKNKLKLKLVCSNLFNNDTFSTLNISDTGSYSASYRLLPRYFLLSLDYRF